ncbi:MAG: helix-turn-helix transcriptional regulator, partial [Actinomycetota bacterium]|nr:helix-turn-helix transcriptional regulator [Actinomycetota bacterium]
HEALAERVVERGLQAARASGSVVAGAVSSTISARLLLARGSLVAAEGSARHALRVSRANGLRLLEPFALASLLESLLDQGRADDAEHELADDAAGRASCEGLGGCLLLIARGRLRGSRADTELGLADVLTAGARLLQASCSTPGFDWHSRAALLAHRLDRRREAARLVDDELALAERLGAPRPLGVALRARALVSPPGTQIELLTAAVETLRGTPARLDFARALCDLGSAHRRSGSRRDAPGPLRAGLQLAHECGASALAERARQELVVLGARPRRHAVTGIDALTARELQASELAAEGLTNRQIAAAMSVTANTVEYHLTNAYRKLGIETRERLGGALGRGLVGGRGRAVVVDLG